MFDFPSLWVAALWVEAHCVIPDGFDKGRRFTLSGWQLACLVNNYRIKPTAEVGQLAPAFQNRRSQIVLPQKAGKGPYAAAYVCLEGVGPALFAGWARGGEKYRCVDHGCGCPFEHEYGPGEPMGAPWPTPLIQITAFSEEQTGNVYDALRPMIEEGPLSDVIPKTGEEFIRLPGGGRIDAVTSSAQSRLGQRITAAVQDETGIWTARNKMVKVAETQRRGLAGMGGRALETTNAFDPSEDSVARRTSESSSGDVFRYHPKAPANLSYGDKRERRKIHEYVYDGCPWVDLDAIDAEAAEIFEKDPAQAMRFFGNMVVAGKGRAVDPDVWDALARPQDVPAGTRVGLGFDGSISNDATVLRACTAEGYSFIVGCWLRPFDAKPGWKVPRLKVHQAVRDAFSRYDVGMMLCDPWKWISEIEGWAKEFGEERVVQHDTNSDRRMGPSVGRWLTAIEEGTHTHDGHADTSEHVKNAHLRKCKATADENDGRTLYTLTKGDDGGKIDAAVADVLALEAACSMPVKKRLQIFI